MNSSPSDYIEVPKIDKPLHDNFVAVRNTYIKQAIQENKKLKITIPQGSAIVDAWDWIATGTKIEKEFLIEGKPMVLIANYLKV